MMLVVGTFVATVMMHTTATEVVVMLTDLWRIGTNVRKNFMTRAMTMVEIAAAEVRMLTVTSIVLVVLVLSSDTICWCGALLKLYKFNRYSDLNVVIIVVGERGRRINVIVEATGMLTVVWIF